MTGPVYAIGSQRVWLFRTVWVSITAGGSLWGAAITVRRYTDMPVLALAIITLCMFAGS